jgi:fibronectin-binding autotransporter adhesin
MSGPKSRITRAHLSRHVRALLAAAIVGTAAVSGQGSTTDTYTGATSASWDVGGNWSLNAPPMSSNDATFNSTIPATGATVSLNNAEVANSVVLNGGYTLNMGSSASLTVTSGVLTDNSSTAAAISGGVITSISDPTLPELTVNVSTAGSTFTIGSAISNGSTAAGVDVAVNGPGTLVLGSTDTVRNNFAGGLFINSGAAQISSDANLGANVSTNQIILETATLATATNTITLGSNRSILVDQGPQGGSGITGVQSAISVTTAGTQFILNGANQLTGSLISGTNTTVPLTVNGPGALVINNTNSYNGAVTVNNGILQLQNPAALGGTGTNATQSSIALNNGGQLNLRTDGPFTAADANGNSFINFGNNVTVNAPGGSATINIDHLTSASPNGTAPLGVLNVQLGALNLPANNSILNITGNANTSATPYSLAFSGTTTIGLGPTSANVTINNSVNVRLGGPVTGNGGLTKTGSGILAMSGFAPNTFTNLTQVLGGILALNDTAGNAVPGDLVITGGTVVMMTNSQIADSSNVSVNTAGALQVNGNQDTVGTLNMNNGALTTGGGTLSVAQLAGPGNRMGGLSHDGTGGNGFTTLSGGSFQVNPGLVNGVPQGGTYNTVGLFISGGTNQVDATCTMNVGSVGVTFSGANPSMQVLADSASPGSMVLGGDVTYASAGTAMISNSPSGGTLPGALNLGGTTRTFTINSGSVIEISAAVTNGNIVVAGGGLLRLDTANTFTGGITITTGTLEARNPGALGTGPVTFNGGTLNLLNDAASTTWNNSLTVPAAATSINVNMGGITGNPGIFNFNALTLGVALNVGSPGTGTGTGGNLVFSGPITLQTTSNQINFVTCNGNATTSFDGVISGPDSLEMTGTGTVVMGGSSNNTYGGSTIVQGGSTLQLSMTSGAIAIPSTGLTITGSTVLLTASQQMNPAIIVTLNNTSGPAKLNLNGQTETVGYVTTSVASSTAQIALGSGTIIFNPTTTFTYSGAITGTAASSVQDNGTPTIALNGTNSGFTGGATVNAGTLDFVTAPGSLSGTTLASGTWNVVNGAILQFPSGASITTNQANVTLTGPSAPSFPAFAGFTTNGSQGSFTVTGGLTFSTAGAFTNNGTLTVGPSSTINVTGAVGNLNGGATLAGGTWIVDGGATLNFPSGASITTNQANVTLGGANASFPAFTGFTTNGPQGSFTVTGGASYTTTGTLANNGNVNVGASGSLSGSISGTGTTTVAAGGTLTATALTQNTLANSGSASVTSSGTINGPVTGTGSLTLGNGTTAATLTAATVTQNSLTINNGSALTLTQGGMPTVSLLNSLTLNGTGTLDLKNNGFILYFSGASPLATIAAEINSGRNVGGTAWTGTGITSSVVAADPSQLTIVYGLASAILPLGGTFLGQTIPAGATAVLARTSLIGDANGDGSVNSKDLVQIISRGHYNDGTTGNTPFDGAFTGVTSNGTVSSADINAIVASGNYNSGSTFSAVTSFNSQTNAALKGASASNAASPNNITGGAPSYDYNPSTGDLTFNRNGFSSQTIQTLTVSSASGLFQVGAASGYTANQIANGNGADINSATEQFALNFNGFGSSIDLGDILPTGLTQSALQSDLSFYYEYPGGALGPVGDGMAADIVSGVPEPFSLMLMAAGIASLAMRRRRRTRHSVQSMDGQLCN